MFTKPVETNRLNGDYFLIRGGQPLSGEISLAGAKNAASKMIIATLLTDEECILKNFPDIGDSRITLELCSLVGGEMKLGDSSLSIKTAKVRSNKVTSLSRRNRIPILALGPLLARSGEAFIPFVGGDKIGPRPVDMHLEALKSLGAVITVDADYYHAVAPNGLRGAEINFRYPSVGATENAILASVLARGRTVIKNAATEPEIIDLIKMLQNMGAIIELGANRQITIYGVSKLHGASHQVLPDRNEAVSFACLAIATNGEILVRGAIQEHLITFLNTVRRIGGEYEVLSEGIRFWRKNNLHSIAVETDTHPGFMTDWQQPLTIVLTQSEGRSIIHETVYEDRFHYIKDLNLMGGQVKVVEECLGEIPCRFQDQKNPHTAIVLGPSKLHGANIIVSDLRAGIAHLIAALTAAGESKIYGIEEIDRGYEKIDQRLKKLGADIERIKSS